MRLIKIPHPEDYTESSWAALALARFILSIIVFFGHLVYFSHLPYALLWVHMLGGKAAVLGFFLISGVSVGHSYSQRATHYFKRRFLRIYPLYFWSVTFTIILIYSTGSHCNLPGIQLVAPGFKTDFANL